MALSSSSLFVYGTLCQTRIRRKILGRVLDGEPARLCGYARVKGKWPYLMRKPGGVVRGQILKDLTRRDWKALDAYEDVKRGLYVRRRLRLGKSTPYVYLPVLKNWPRAWR